MRYMSFESLELRNWVYTLHPRPVVVVVAGSWDEYSAMPASWIMPVSRSPPVVAIAIARTRYTYELIKKYREFSICILSSEHLDKIHFLGTKSGREIRDKIVVAGLRKERSRKISTPIIAESIVVLECRLRDIVEAGDHDIVIGEIIEAYKRKDVDISNPESYQIPLHIGGNKYTVPKEKTIAVEL